MYSRSGIPLYNQIYYIKVVFKGVYFPRTCNPDVLYESSRPKMSIHDHGIPTEHSKDL